MITEFMLFLITSDKRTLFGDIYLLNHYFLESLFSNSETLEFIKKLNEIFNKYKYITFNQLLEKDPGLINLLDANCSNNIHLYYSEGDYSGEIVIDIMKTKWLRNNGNTPFYENYYFRIHLN